MGQKVHPKIFRMNTVETWYSKWFSRRELPTLLREDVLIRAYLMKTLREASVDRVDIERGPGSITVIIHSAKPGFIIGRAGTGAEELKTKIKNQFFQNRKIALNLNIVEVPRASLSATIVAEQAAMDIEKRMPFRRVMKQVVDRVQKSGAQGIRIRMKGRLGGAEIARSEQVAWGNIPLQNLRANIDYAHATARTVYGAVGVKVWIYKGEVFEKDQEQK
jgi:small subunit ribosomal protein S3